MAELEIFHTLAEMSVAIAGFSSLIIIFRGNAADWSRLDYTNFSFLLVWSIGGVFLSLLPLVLVEFGWNLITVSKVGIFSAISYMFIVGGVLTKVKIQLESHALALSKKSLIAKQMPWRNVMSANFLIIFVIAFAAGLGILGGPQHAWYALIIVMLLVHSCAELGTFLVKTPPK